MPAYVIVNVDVHDAEGYREYVALAPAEVARYGGRYLVRGGPTEVLEGGYEPKRVVLLEFPSFERAQAWHASAEYDPVKDIRLRCAETDMILVEGLEEPL